MGVSNRHMNSFFIDNLFGISIVGIGRNAFEYGVFGPCAFVNKERAKNQLLKMSLGQRVDLRDWGWGIKK